MVFALYCSIQVCHAQNDAPAKTSDLDRIIPQIYSEEMLKYIDEIYSFDDYIYTLYQTDSSEEAIITFARSNDIKVVTMAPGRFNEDFQAKLSESGILIYLHTINSPEVMEDYLKKGVHGFYTDFLSPDMIKRLSK